jgi:hypothetical protein
MAQSQRSLLYLVTALIALIVALICVAFSFMGGFGFAYLLSTLTAVLSIALGIGLSFTHPGASRLLSAAGVILCGIPLIRDIIEIAGLAPSILLIPPIVLLLLLLAHLVTLFERRPVEDADLNA